MSCVSFSGGITNDCSNNMGGVTKLYITDFSNVVSYTEEGGTVSAITMATASYFYEFQFNRNSAEFTENLTKSVEAGSALFEQTITVTIAKRDVAKRNTLALLTQRDLAVVVKDSNGLYWYAGEVEGMYLSEGTSTTGKAKADGSNYVLTLKGFEQNRAPAVTGSVILAKVAV